MKNLSRLVLSTFCFTFASVEGNAQQIYPDSIKDAHDSDADQNQQVYSQAQSLTEKLPLDLMAVNEPEQFAGLAVTSMEGVDIGKVLAVARKKSDQGLYLIINTHDGVPTAIRIDELTLAALAYWDPAGSLNDEHFQETDFEPISQYQTGHTARGSLTRPMVEPVPNEFADQPDDADAAIAADAAVLEVAAPGSSNSAPVYKPVGSSVGQLALNRPDAFQQKLLIGEQGETLGQIAYLARNLQNQELYAVVTLSNGGAHTAVKLDALRVGSLVSQGFAQDAQVQAFDEDEFETLGDR